MKLNSFKQITLAGLLGLASLTGCQKEDDLPTAEVMTDENTSKPDQSAFASRMVDLTEKYDYYGDKFSVTYRFDQEKNEVVDAWGDLEKAEALFAGDDYPKGRILTVGNKEIDPTTKIQIFDTVEEAERAFGEEPQNSKSCNWYSMPGDGTYHFYYHANYVSEMPELTFPGKKVVSHEGFPSWCNDQISSIWGDGPERFFDYIGYYPYQLGRLTLYVDNCFGGAAELIYIEPTRSFSHHANGRSYYRHKYDFMEPNLNTMSVYVGFWQGWQTWNDQISSVKYSWGV